MLPFSDKGDKRKYVCFVCGIQHTDYADFKKHIIEQHDEGREYIVCKACEAPIRDVRTHYQFAHRGTPAQDGQQKALVWRDFSTNKKKTKKPKFKKGHFVSLKNDGKLMYYRSGWELEVYECLEQLNEVTKYDVEAFQIPYYWQGEWHRYYPDLVINFDDGHTEIWEIKPYNQTDIEQNRMKWDACYKICQNHGYKFVVQTEFGINKLRKSMLKKS